MSALKFLSLWLMFAATYVVFFILIFLVFPEAWLYNLYTDHGKRLTEPGDSEAILILVIMLLSLVINLIFIPFSLSIKQRLSKSTTRDFQNSSSVRMGVFKFSSLWLLFAVTYFLSYSLIFSIFPEMWLYRFFLEPRQEYIEQEKWATIYLSALLLSALIINLVFIFLSLTIAQRLRNRKNCTDGHT